MRDDYTVGGMTLCKKTIFKWCRKDADSGEFINPGGVCVCGANRLPEECPDWFTPLLPPGPSGWERINEEAMRHVTKRISKHEKQEKGELND